jgi:8-oxo-dGTP pyrophosphatase MutT (NUDIX family)
LKEQPMEMPQFETFETTANPAAFQQVAALCWRMHKGQTQMLLITSRGTGRWVLPKGWPITGLTPPAAAAREAWEEAGVEGKVTSLCLGEFLYDKVIPAAAVLSCAVAVYPLRVRALRARYPEAKQRRRAWFNASDAADRVDEPSLQALLRRIDATPGLLSGTA